MKISRRETLAAAALALTGPAWADTAPAQIYAAMTFRKALDAVLAAYRAQGGAAVAVYGPTPVLVQQIAAGAPADIFLSADTDWMDDATRRGLIRSDSRGDLLANDLVLAGPPQSTAARTITPGFAMTDALAGGRLAMCDPEHDPAGRYAKQSLQALGFWPSVAPHIAIAETSLAAVTLLDHGEVRSAVVFATDLRGDTGATVIGRFPASSHAPIVYPVALTQGSRNPHAAGALQFLRSPQALQIFTGFGYRAPG